MMKTTFQGQTACVLFGYVQMVAVGPDSSKLVYLVSSTCLILQQ